MIQVCTHSYSKEIAGVVEIKSVIGGCNFFTRRCSCGARIPNYMGDERDPEEASKCWYQLNDLDEHPIVGRSRKNVEQWRGKR